MALGFRQSGAPICVARSRICRLLEIFCHAVEEGSVAFRVSHSIRRVQGFGRGITSLLMAHDTLLCMTVPRGVPPLCNFKEAVATAGVKSHSRD